MSNELTDVRCPCGAEFQADSYDAGFIAGSGMCQNCDAALPPKDICTCPSGDGSLRWPCPKHPAVEHERAEFEAWVRRDWPGAPLRFIRDALPVDDPRYGQYCDDALQRAWVGWQARAALAQPSPAQAEQAEAERPEVVAWRYGSSGGIVSDKACLDEWKSGGEYQSLMTVVQHERIVGALRFERQQMDRAFTACINERDAANARLHEVATACATAEQERDAALARVAELDKQCRDDVARALGLRPSQERGFAWSYLLASIKSCVKASEDAAQAQHSVPEGYALIPVRETDAMHDAVMALLYKGVARTDTQKLLDAYIAAAPGKEGA
ncbi:hypothetical protein ACM75T_30150 [Pseudomonas aeruginosa]